MIAPFPVPLPQREPEPLHRHGRLRTSNPELTQHIVSEAYEPHRLRIAAGAALDAKLNAVETGRLTLGYLSYGPRATIELPASEHWYHVNITLTGGSRVTREDGSRERTRALESACVLLPHRAQQIEWEPGTAQFALRVARQDLEDTYATLAGRPAAGPIDFPLTFALATDAGRGLLRSINFVREEWDEDGVMARRSATRRHLDSLMLTSLIFAASGSVLPGEAETPTAGPGFSVAAATEWIREHAHTLPTLADLAEACGVSARTLQQHFLRELGCSPTQALRVERLRRAREDLLFSEGEELSVTDIAVTWGFYHLGRFSALYRSTYQESPSETLRRARA